MIDELKYPRAYALMKVPKQKSDGGFYIVSPCYIVKELLIHMADGRNEKGYEIVYPRRGYNSREEQIPEINKLDSWECINGFITDYITYDYEEAIKERDRVNSSLLASLRPKEGETFGEMYRRCREEIEFYQEELNKLEPKEQVKKKLKTPAKL